MPVLAPYAAAELARLKTITPAEEVFLRPEHFTEAEEAFEKIVGTIPSLSALVVQLRRTSHARGLPRQEEWPNFRDVVTSFQGEQLQAIGEQIWSAWARHYSVDEGALLHRIELVAVLDLANACIRIIGSATRQEAEGLAYLDAIRALQPDVLKRLDEQEWWNCSDEPTRARVTYLTTIRVLAEADQRTVQEANAKRRWIAASRNVGGAVSALGNAPFVIWQRTHDDLRAQRAVEQRMQEQFPKVDLRRLDAPVGWMRGKVKGPVGIALDGLGMHMPGGVWGEFAQSVLNRIGRNKGGDVSSWALARFAVRVIRTVARYAVLAAATDSLPVPYSGQAAKSVVAAYATDLAHLRRTTKSGIPSAAAARLLFWSAVCRGWEINWRVLPSRMRTANELELSLRTGEQPVA